MPQDGIFGGVNVNTVVVSAKNWTANDLLLWNPETDAPNYSVAQLGAAAQGRLAPGPSADGLDQNARLQLQTVVNQCLEVLNGENDDGITIPQWVADGGTGAPGTPGTVYANNAIQQALECPSLQQSVAMYAMEAAGEIAAFGNPLVQGLISAGSAVYSLLPPSNSGLVQLPRITSASAGGGQVGDGAAIASIQASLGKIAAGFGGLSLADANSAIQQDVWSFVPGGFGGPNNAGDIMGLTSAFVETTGEVGLVRSRLNPNIWVNVEGADPIYNFAEFAAFALLDPSNMEEYDETELAMCQRLYPASNWGGISAGWFPACQVVDADGFVVNYVYIPRAPTLKEYYHMWDYVPTSGPPTRNYIHDAILIMAMLPIQFPIGP